MRDPLANPFSDPDRRAIWEMLVPRDIDAFLAADWSMVADDFVKIGFFALDAQKKQNPDDWRLGFPDLAHYRDEWVRQAQDFAKGSYADDPRTAIFNATPAGGDRDFRRQRAGAQEIRWRHHPRRWRI